VKLIVSNEFVTEMTAEQLETVYGGGGAPLGLGGGIGGGGGLGGAFSASQASEARVHSFAGFCDVNIFSNNLFGDTEISRLLSIANHNTQVCANND
jgi:hypothetical protein